MGVPLRAAPVKTNGSVIGPARRPLRVLTFCRHEPYLHNLAKTGHDFEVCERHIQSLGYVRKWNPRLRPVPANVRLISEAEMKERSRDSYYDTIVCHDVEDLLSCVASPSGKVLVFHNAFPYSETDLLSQALRKREFVRSLQRLFLKAGNVHFVFISEFKKQNWGLPCPARVIVHGIDTTEFPPHTGDVPSALRVCNGITRAKEGFRDLLAICDGLPLRVVGDNDDGVKSESAESFDALKEIYQSGRVFVNTTVEGLEDGYTLCMLEAMAAGMPIITTWNRSSPIQNGVNGHIAADRAVLHDRLRELIESPETAARLGAEARKTVECRFPMANFVANWNEMLRDASLFTGGHA